MSLLNRAVGPRAMFQEERGRTFNFQEMQEKTLLEDLIVGHTSLEDELIEHNFSPFPQFVSYDVQHV